MHLSSLLLSLRAGGSAQDPQSDVGELRGTWPVAPVFTLERGESGPLPASLTAEPAPIGGWLVPFSLASFRNGDLGNEPRGVLPWTGARYEPTEREDYYEATKDEDLLDPSTWIWTPPDRVFLALLKEKSPDGFELRAVKEHIFAITRRWMDPDGDGDPSDGIGMWGSDDPNNRKPMLWRDLHPYTNEDEDCIDEDLQAYYRRAIALRRAHVALRVGTFEAVLADDAQDLLVFHRQFHGDELIVALTPEQDGATFTLPTWGWRVVFGPESHPRDSAGSRVGVPGCGQGGAGGRVWLRVL